MIGHTVRLLVLQTLVVVIVATCFWIWMPSQWNVQRGPIGMLTFAFAITFPLHLFRAVLEGLQDLKYLGQVQMASWLAGTAFTIGLVIHFGLYALAIGWTVTELVSAMACLHRLRTKFTGHCPPKCRRFQVGQ